jgi:uncharacterized protein (DUF952 family)
MLIYHLVLPEKWEAFDSDLYMGESLLTQGFIHCSFEPQLDVVIDRYYSDVDRVMILEIDTDLLMSRTINEVSSGNEIYPHVYGPINRKAIVRVLERDISEHAQV